MGRPAGILVGWVCFVKKKLAGDLGKCCYTANVDSWQPRA